MEASTPPLASESIDVRIARIYRRDDGIVCVQVKDDVDIDILDSRESYEAVKSLASGTKVAILSLTGSGGTITREVQMDWITKKSQDVVIAEAVVARSLAHRIVVNFVMNFYDVGRPMKMFTEEEEAVDWLKRHMERENKR